MSYTAGGVSQDPFLSNATGGASAAAAVEDEENLPPPPQLPTGDRGYYACRSCRRILTEMQWYAEGCSDCQTGPIRRGEINEYATTHFSNFIGLIDPQRSWVARLIQKTDCNNGVFAEALSDEDDMFDEEDGTSVGSNDGGNEFSALGHDGEEGEELPTAGGAAAPQHITDDELFGLEGV